VFPLFLYRKRNARRDLVGKYEGKQPPEKPRQRRKDILKCYLGKQWRNRFIWIRIGTGGAVL